MAPPPDWVAPYIGLEFEERGRGPRFDCWGLVREILARQFGVDVPSLACDYDHLDDRERLAQLVELEGARHVEVPLEDSRDPRERFRHAKPGDVALIRMGGLPVHQGIIVAPFIMVHIARSSASVWDDITRPAWCRRIEGLYRHEKLA